MQKQLAGHGGVDIVNIANSYRSRNLFDIVLKFWD